MDATMIVSDNQTVIFSGNDVVRSFKVKLKNRRVILSRLTDGSYYVQFINLVGRNIKRTNLLLSNEALSALFVLFVNDKNSAPCQRGTSNGETNEH
jgi:hypothetical protein